MSCKQMLLWIPQAETLCGTSIIPEVPFNHPVPSTVFLLDGYSDEAAPPALPFIHDNTSNIAPEDRSNWEISNGYFVYMNRNSSGGIWALLEYEE